MGECVALEIDEGKSQRTKCAPHFTLFSTEIAMKTPEAQSEITKAASYRLILILDPGGKLKNGLLESWIQGNDFPTAWMRLDATANDPHCFLADIQNCLNSIGFPTDAEASSPSISLEDGIIRLLNAALDRSADTYLVLDDYHWIHNPAIHQAIAWMLEYLPDQVHLVLTSQMAPPLPLARLRLRHQLLEIHLG